ncbi:uncharacterized protein LOC106181128 [Lingula anatina]|uniref:Uncharacterized protein LOC106181128 n=1 Tax=Lingula anatina TaxID=7574 RepID=A0A1S3KE25_LINAN|nr:uncharacterized protein LOC106181128 [Lingula anatina]|eukprot:XP_013420880.1 uncharacterized protein LOC106181128 [Lingula anatina]
MHVTSTPISKETLPLPCRRTDLTGVGNKDKSVSLVSDPTTAAVVSPIKSTRGTGRKRKQAGVDLLVETEPAQSSANLSKKSVKSQRRTKGGTVVSPTKENEKPAGSKVKEGGVKKSKKLGKKEEMLNKRKVKLKKTWRVLSDRSMQKLFQSEIDGEDFAGFNDSNDAIPELPTDVSYVDLTEIEIDENSEIEWILTNYEAEKQDHYLRSLKMHINTSLDDINEPSDWADQCYHYLEDSIERGKKQQISQKNLMVIPPPERKSPRKSPIKSPVKMVTTRFPLRTTDPYRHEEGKTGIYQLLKEVCCLENIQLERRKMERQDVKRNEKARGSQNIGSDHGVVKGGNMVGKREKIKSNGFQTNRAKNQVASSTTVAVRCHQSQTSSVKMHGQSQSKTNSRRNSVQGALKSHNTNESGVHKRGTDEESVQIIKVTRKNSTSKVILIEVPGSEVDSVEEKTDDIHLSIAKHVTPLDNGQIGQLDQIEGQSGGFEPASDHVDTLVESQGKGLEPSSEIIEFSPPPLNTSTPLRTEITSAPLQSGATRRVKKERLSRSRKSSRIEGASVRDEGEEENPSRLVTSGQNVTKTDNGQSVSTKRGKAACSKSHSSSLVTGEKQDEVIFKRRRRRSTSSVDSIASTIPEISAATAQHGNKVRRRSLEVKNKDVIDDAYDIHEEDFEIRFNYASPQRRRKAFCSLKATDPNVVISPRRSNSAMSKSRGSLKNSAMNRKRKSSGLKGRKLFAGKLSVTPSNGAETVRRNLQKNPLNVSKNSWGDDNRHTQQESTEKPRVYNYNVFQSKAFRRSVSMAFDTSVDQAEAQTPVKPDVGGRTSRRLCKTSPSKNAQSPNFGERKWKNWKYSMMVQGNVSPSKTLKILSASPVKSPNTLRCREERSGKDCFASPSNRNTSGERFLKNWKYAKMTQGSVSPTKSAKIISTSPNRLQRSPGKKRNSPQKRANDVRKHAFARADRDSVKRKLLTQAKKEKCP